MNWNYRILKSSFESNGIYFEEYGIVEAYYNEEGFITMYTKEYIDPNSDTINGLDWTLRMMLEAMDRPVIDDNDFIPNTLK